MSSATHARHAHDAIDLLRKARILTAAAEEPNQASIARLRAAVEQTKSALVCLQAAHEALHAKIN